MTNLEYDLVYKEKLHNAFRFAIDFFQKHNLSWFCAFGTAIGAVRHNDIIPWDDDIDLLMPRNDYDRLLGLKEEFLGTGYTVVSPKDDNYCLPFAKIIDLNTTIWEAPRYPFVLGVFIDIFPLDSSDLTDKEYKSALKSFTHSANKLFNCQTSYSFAELLYDVENNYKGAILTGFRSLFYSKRAIKKAREDFLAKEKLFYSKDGYNCMSFSGFYGSKEIYKKDWFNGYVEMPFHDYMVRVPKGYDEYLTQLYGDYMQLPPENKRVTHHGHYYLNLAEKLGIEEIKKKKKKGETLVY